MVRATHNTISNPQMSLTELPWNFEAFRNYISFETLQQAAAALVRYDGKLLFADPALMTEFTQTLKSRTALDWVPKRVASEGVLFETEGNIFRNKARVFTSFYIIDPSCLSERNELRMTELGRALGLGYISKSEFYKEVVTRFEYPHPAYDENWTAWSKAGVRLKPLVFILNILLSLYESDKIAAVTASELAAYAHPCPEHNLASEIASNILAGRETDDSDNRRRSDQVDRKLNDILGFLCIAGYTYYYNGNFVRLNLLSIHGQEKSHFWHKRKQEDTLLEFRNMIDSAKEEIL